MKYIVTICLFISVSFCLSGCGSNNNSNNEVVDNNLNLNKRTLNTSDFANNTSKNEETEISNFSTPLTSGVANRITNIKITSEKINGLTLKNGETFSFNEIIGPCTAEEGYKEAEIYVNKKIEYALGGGNCQVSTTLYNAALAVKRNCYSRKT